MVFYGQVFYGQVDFKDVTCNIYSNIHFCRQLPVGKKFNSSFPDGTGVIYGIDFSQEMVAVASRALANEIKERKVKVTLGDVMSMPYKAQSFDVVYHCNCFYFWPDLHKAAIEIQRVMKLGSTMVTTINVVSLKAAADAGFLHSANTIDHNLYMDVLKEVGFQNVRMEDCDDKGFKFQVIYADFKGDMKSDTMKNIAE